MTTINPFVIGGGAAVATSLAVGIGATKLMDGVAERHPTGSEADRPAGRIQWGAAGLGFASAAGGMVAFMKGNQALGAALFGTGAGAMVGSFGAGLAFAARHGVGVETSIQNVLDGYDHNDNGVIDMDSGSWWRGPETLRTETDSYTDSDGDTHYDTYTYSIERLATTADTDRNWKVTAQELRATIGGYDGDANGRLQKDELTRFQREVGEQFMG